MEWSEIIKKIINLFIIYLIYIYNDIFRLDIRSWEYLSYNQKAIFILEQYPDKIVWTILSGNSNAICLLEQNLDKINWYMLSGNPNAIHLLEKNQEINWSYLSENPSIFEEQNNI